MPDIVIHILKNGVSSVIFAAVTVFCVRFLMLNRQYLRRFPTVLACMLCGVQALTDCCMAAVWGMLQYGNLDDLKSIQWMNKINDWSAIITYVIILVALISLFGNESDDIEREKGRK